MKNYHNSDRLVEIFVQTYNREYYLTNCLKSLLNQTYQNIKIIVVDNKSDYNVELLIKRFNVNNIQLITNPINLGSAESFNISLTKVSGDFVMFFHDDDALPPYFVENQVQLLLKHPDAGFVCSTVNITQNPEEILNFEPELEVEYDYFKEKGALLPCFFTHPIFGSSSILFDSNIVKNMKSEYEIYNKVNDRAFMLRVSNQAPFIFMKNIKYNALWHSGQDSYKRDWDFKYDINVTNLYLRTCYKFGYLKFEKQIIKMFAGYYVYSFKKPKLFTIYKNFNFYKLSNKIYFFALLPTWLIKSNILNNLKEHHSNFYHKIISFKKLIS
jgi:glycosyltransferase involved in cell wall biosynthesis